MLFLPYILSRIVVTALPGLVPIFVLAGGGNALAGVLFVKDYG